MTISIVFLLSYNGVILMFLQHPPLMYIKTYHTTGPLQIWLFLIIKFLNFGFSVVSGLQL